MSTTRTNEHRAWWLIEPYTTIVDEVSAQDRAWFEQHPGVDVRVRAAVPGELGPPMEHYAGKLTLVTQLQPGIRHRRCDDRASGGTRMTTKRPPKVKRTPEQRYTDLQRALTLAPTPLARVVIGRALARMQQERER